MNTEKKKRKRDEEKKKKDDEEKEEKEQQQQTSSSKKVTDPKVAKRRRDDSSERASKKSKRHSHSSEGSSERKHKSKTNKHKKMKRDYDDPTVQKIEKLKKTIRGCGVPITGFHKDMSNDRTLRKLLEIIQKYEKDGMKEKMKRDELLKVRASIEAQREVDELKRIPKKLQISGKHPRKVTRNKPKYDIDLEKASSSASETPSETHSNYSSGAD